VRPITSLDQVDFADAYLAGDTDIAGDMRPVQLFTHLPTIGAQLRRQPRVRRGAVR
jgi:hypothetical protein